MTRVWSAALAGVEGALIEVEVRISSQLPRVDVVGLPEAAVRESVSRIRGAIAATGLTFPDRRVTINLAPAELRKHGAGLDLPIAIGVLAASDSIAPDALADRGFVGELALDGRLRPTRGTLAAVLAIRDAGVKEALVPTASAQRACHAPGIRVVGVDDLGQVLAHLQGTSPRPATLPATSPGASDLQTAQGALGSDLSDSSDSSEACDGPDSSGTECLSDIRGQAHAKRALEIAAAGGHGLLMTGPPGVGKTLLARRLRGLLPPLDGRERLESLCVLDASGLLPDESAIPSLPPFRAPHHSASAAGLLGGGSPVRPGEVSLAHHGVLFLDELPEFDRRCLESLREVLEQGVVRIARANFRCELPARIQLVAAANPCPCGYFGSPDRDCRCDDAALARYRKRLSGPLLDRIDLTVALGTVPWGEMRGPKSGPSSQLVRERVAAARERARSRGIHCNAAIADGHLDELVVAQEAALDLLGRAVESLHLSARAARRTLRVARTVADLEGQVETGPEAVAEALQMRHDP